MSFDPITIDETTGDTVSLPANTGRHQVTLRISGDRVWINFNSPAEVGKCQYFDDGDVARFWGDRATADVYLVTDTGQAATGYYVDGQTNMEIVPGSLKDDGKTAVKLWPNENLIQQPLPHINLMYGDDLAQDGEFSGTPVLLYDENTGPAAEWTPSAILGIWNFADTTNPKNGSINIDATGVANGNIMQLATESPVDFTNYTSLTIWISLTQALDFDAGQDFQVYAWDVDGAVIVGNSINISNYIDQATTGQYLRATIPRDDMGLATSTVSAFRIQALSDLAGAPNGPKAQIDYIQIQELGGALQYSTIFAQPSNSIFYMKGIKTYYRGPLNPGSTPYPDMDLTKYFHLDQLSSGLTNIISSDGVIIAAVTFTNLETNVKLAESSLKVVSYSTEAAESVIEINIVFPGIIALFSEKGDASEITLSDNLNSFALHTVYAVGNYEKV